MLDLPIPEAGKRLKHFLFGKKRLPGESMKIYASKHRTTLMKLEEAIQTVEKRDRQKILLEVPAPAGSEPARHAGSEPARSQAGGTEAPE
eukprot:5956338-Alexandrium_andersonii.AAC.1